MNTYLQTYGCESINMYLDLYVLPCGCSSVRECACGYESIAHARSSVTISGCVRAYGP